MALEGGAGGKIMSHEKLTCSPLPESLKFYSASAHGEVLKAG